jgi:hypothetical protein
VPNVNKFLFCFKLETGGWFLGWLGAVGAAIGFLVSSLSFGLIVYSYDAFLNSTTLDDEHREAFAKMKYREMIGKSNDDDSEL